MGFSPPGFHGVHPAILHTASHLGCLEAWNVNCLSEHLAQGDA